MSDPLISVLVPAFNRIDTLEQCVLSAINNKYASLQIIISDNGSTDGTADLALRLAERDSRIEVICHVENRGPLPNWKSCLERARGSLIHWLWSDDWIEPNFYRSLVSAMQQHQAQMALCAVRIHTGGAGSGQVLYRWGNQGRSGREAARLLASGRGLKGPVSPACALLPAGICRAAFTDQIPPSVGIDCNKRAIGCDAVMMISCAWTSATVASVELPLATFRAHSGSISVSSKAWFLAGHYAWARLWLAKKLPLPWSWGHWDRLRLVRFWLWHAFKHKSQPS